MREEGPRLILQANRPEVISADIQAIDFGKRSDAHQAIVHLQEGKYILINELFSDGLALMKSLQYFLKQQHPGESFKEQRAFRNDYNKLSQHILLEVKDHELQVKKAPSISWLQKLYPELNEFRLSFPQIQGLNSAAQWYASGIQIPVLRNKIHPYYGVYFPTRFDHLILFDNWLKRYEGPNKSAIDVGVGSGVLAYQLIKHGFQKVIGTDTNPNAIIGLQEAMEGTKLSRKIELQYGNLFANIEKTAELIVFNPPWLATVEDILKLDQAIYYNDQLFPAFFEAAKNKLSADGKLVILFSNLGQLTDLNTENPIEMELKNGKNFILEAKLTRPVKAASEKTKRKQNWREDEAVELWVLKHRN